MAYPAAGSSELSVTEIQQALRDLRAQHGWPPAGVNRACAPSQDHHAGGSGPAAADAVAGDPEPGRFAPGWIAVAAAHAGAGASCVALLLADALTGTGRSTRLIEVAAPARAGLSAAADTELGLDDSGCWRLGRRGAALLCRRVSDGPPLSWPDGDDGAVTVVDVGLPGLGDVARMAEDGPLLVLVCRAGVPGVLATELLLEQLPDPIAGRVTVAAVGPKRWPGAVAAAAGRRLETLRAAGRVVRVPTDRRLELTGPACGPLPRPLLAAGRHLLDRIDLAEHGGDQTRAAGPSSPGEDTR